MHVMFPIPSIYTFGDMLRTKIQSKNLQRAITLKILKTELWLFCSALLLNEFYTCVKFQVLAVILLEICSGQKFKVKMYKGQ